MSLRHVFNCDDLLLIHHEGTIVNIVTIPYGGGGGQSGVHERKPVVAIQSRFNTNSSSEILQKFLHFKYSLRVNKKKIGVNIRRCFKPNTWN